MEIANWTFVICGGMILLPTLYILFTSDIIRAAFAFVFVVLGLAGLYVLLQAELVAVVQILIYAGGIIVLLIFGVMLTKEISDQGVRTSHHQVLPAILIGLTGLSACVFFIYNSALKWEFVEVNYGVRTIGVKFLTEHLLAFELIAFVLLVVLIGAAYLAKKSKHSS